MYIPSSFAENDINKLFGFIIENNFGILFSNDQNFPEASHLPFMLNKNLGENGTLIAHFAKANKHWKRISEQHEMLVVFNGPHSYISPSWYENRVTVPTWNYAAVHVYGKPKIIHERDQLLQMVTDLTNFHENQVTSNWSLEEGESIIETELKAIVGIEIEISRIEGKFKFNQNRSVDDQARVLENLDDSICPGVRAIMQENLKKQK